MAHGTRVLVCAESFLPAVNGVTNSVVRTLHHLDHHGYEACVVAPGPGPDLFRMATGGRVRVHRVPSLRLPRYRTLPVGLASEARVLGLLDGYRPDLVHLAAPVVLGRTVGSVAQRLGIRSVAVFQTDLPGFFTSYGLTAAAAPTWAWLRRVHNHADLTLAPTATTARQLEANGFERVKVWGRGVDHRQFTPTRRSPALRRAWGVDGTDPERRVVVGYVGRLAREKRIDRLRALTGDPRIQLVIVGDGPARAALEAALPAAVFTGHLGGAELGEAMASLDVFVHTGEHETFCQTIQEAMASRVAVVAPAAGGPIDLIDHGVDGMLFRAGSDAELGRYATELVSDDGTRRRLAEAGHRRVDGRTWETVGDQLLGHYDTVVGRSRRAA